MVTDSLSSALRWVINKFSPSSQLHPSDTDIAFMRIALAEAKKSKTEDERPHPRVGVVVVEEGGQVTTSYRGELGPGDHAEFTLLEKKLSSDSLAGATVYTTLEPCTTRNHPKVPCAYRLIERKVRRVVIGMLDPNPDICGKGLWILRDANVATDLFPHALMSQLEELNREFIRAHRPPTFRPPVRLQAVSTQPEQGSPSPPDPMEQLQEQSFNELYRAMIASFANKDITGAEHAFSRLRCFPDADAGSLAAIKIIYHDMRYRYTGDESDRSAIESFLADPTVGDMAASRLAGLSHSARDYEKAIAYYDQAIAKAHNPRKTTWIIRYAETLVILKRFSDAMHLVTHALRSEISQDETASLLKCLADISKSRGDDLSQAAFLTRAAQFIPADTRARFNAAFALSRVGISQLAFSHYLSVLTFDEEDTGTLNNLGVLCGELGMPCSSTTFFNGAAAGGNTLAAANLALQYLEAGFRGDAERIVEEARKRGDLDPSLGNAITAIGRSREAERDTQEEVTATGVNEQSFLTKYVDAVLASLEHDAFAGTWRTHEGYDVVLKWNDQIVVGEYGAPQNKQRIFIIPQNRAGRIVLEDWESWRDTFGNAKNGYAYVDDDGRKLNLFWMQQKSPSFVTWNRISKNLITRQVS